MSEDDIELELEDEGVGELDEEIIEETESHEEANKGNEENPPAKGNGEDANVRQPTRGELRFQKLANERREAVERAARAEREAEELRRAQANAAQTQQQYQQQLQYQQEQERLRAQWDNASPEDRVAMMLQQQQMQMQRMAQQQQLHMLDTADKMQFDTMSAGDKVAAKYKNEVEARLNTIRQAGGNARREDIYKHLLGEKLLAQRAKAAESQGRTGKANIARQSTPPRRASGDREGGRTVSDEREARRKRLENMVF